MKICVDTNAYTAFKRGDEAVTGVLENAGEVLLPSIVVGELFAGFHMGSRRDRNIEELNDFLAKPGVSIVDIDRSIAERYGVLIKTLREKGTPIPTNDIWIAAVALDTGARLLTLDDHFQYVPGLFRYPAHGT